jgi:hypothetical protein
MGRFRLLSIGIVLALVLAGLFWWFASRHSPPGGRFASVTRYYFHLQPQSGYEQAEWREAVVAASERHSEPENPIDGPHQIIRYDIYEYKENDAKAPDSVFFKIDVGPNFSSKTEAEGAEEALKEYRNLGRHFTILSRSQTP